jgi:hypothetical protein
MIIEIPIEKIKKELAKLLIRLNNFYLQLNQWLLFGWNSYLDKQSPNRLNQALRVLLTNPATALFLNTVLLSGVSMVVSKFLGGVIAGYVNNVIMLNMIIFCANKLDWLAKLKK